jgi:hypothetical protein
VRAFAFEASPNPLTCDSSIELLLAAQTDNAAIPASIVHDIWRYG